MTSETLARAGARGRLVVLKTAMRGGKRSSRSLVSTALTSTLHRCCAPKISRRIPTIPTGVLLGGWLVDVSAVDTGLCGSESGVLGGRARRRRGVEPPPQLPPTLRRLPHPAPATWVPSRVTNVMTSNIELYLAPARRPGGHGSTPAPPRVGLSRSTPRGSGSTGQWLCVLHEGPTYPQYPRPSSSGTPPSCSASRRHRQPSQSPGRPPPTGPSSSSSLRQAHPTGVLRCHDIRNSQKS